MQEAGSGERACVDNLDPGRADPGAHARSLCAVSLGRRRNYQTFDLYFVACNNAFYAKRLSFGVAMGGG